MPCSTRAATSCGRVWASPHSSEPSPNTTIAAPNTRRVPKRSHNHGLAGIRIARVST
ncbi:hypothetical protein RLIN73S_04147 [Rhodanobacter lindaniclasticus]